jgi:NhaA family Na+:H+ antiporter
MAGHSGENGSAGNGGSFSLREFVHDQAFGGILLLAAAVAALAWANSPWGAAYGALWATELTLGTVQLNLTETLRHWVNDGLMAIFFLVVGWRSSARCWPASWPRRDGPPCRRSPPLAVPSSPPRSTSSSTEAARGVPMATDIAFALGVLALLGSRVPAGLKVFLTALAIVDDILAVLVIAVFYIASVEVGALAGAAVVLALLVAANRLGVRALWVYALLGVALWAAVFASGIHATVAGVLLAFTIPPTPGSTRPRSSPAAGASSPTSSGPAPPAAVPASSTTVPARTPSSNWRTRSRRPGRPCSGWSRGCTRGWRSRSCRFSPSPTPGFG